jgi:hypothetical protein
MLRQPVCLRNPDIEDAAWSRWGTEDKIDYAQVAIAAGSLLLQGSKPQAQLPALYCGLSSCGVLITKSLLHLIHLIQLVLKIETTEEEGEDRT